MPTATTHANGRLGFLEMHLDYDIMTIPTNGCGGFQV